MRQFAIDNGTPSPTGRFQIKFQINLTESQERWLPYTLAAFLGISPSSIVIRVKKDPANVGGG